MRVWVICTAFLALALAGCTGGAPTPDAPAGRIDGAVVDHMLGPWPGVDVTLVEAERTTTTTDLGGFSFLDVPPGIYTVRVELGAAGGDEELLIVEADQVSTVILQVWDLPPEQPYVARLAHKAATQLAQPGTACNACLWPTNLNEPPVAVTYMAVWDPQVLGDVETHLDITIRDDEGTVLARLGPEDEERHPMGDRMMRAVLPGKDIPKGTDRLVVDVAFAEDNMAPHIDFEMESLLHIHYGMTEEAKFLLA